MNRTLAIDIGNTHISAGIFCNARLAKKIKIPTKDTGGYRARLRRLTGNERIELTVVSSVVPTALRAIKKALRGIGAGERIVLGENFAVPIENLYRKKSEVGQDRLVNAYAAWMLYGAPAVIIDFGTAVTFDVVSAKGAYRGGLIMPGIGISFSALYERTALLPRVTLKRASSIIGKDTKDSMRAGILFGFGAMCDGLVARYKKMLGRSTGVVLTGGDARLVSQYSKQSYIMDEDLTLKGLYLIAKMSQYPSNAPEIFRKKISRRVLRIKFASHI